MIMRRLGYDENAQLDTLEMGQSNKIKDALVYIIRPENMAEYERQLLVLDNRLKAREEERNGHWSHIGQFIATTPTPVSSFTSSSRAHIDRSATQWQHKNITCPPPELRHHIIQGIKRTTPTEKAWRRANGRCDFCVEPEHAFVTCPKKQQQQLQ
jgi:hypothetical protein